MHNEFTELIGCQHHITKKLFKVGRQTRQAPTITRENRFTASGRFLAAAKGGKMLLFALLFVPATGALSPLQSVSDKLLGQMLKELFVAPPAVPIVTPSDLCKQELTASWLLSPPFTTLTNSSGRGDHLDGTFYEVLDLALNRCCAVLTNSTKMTFIKYRAQATANISMLHQDILSGEADLILPVQSEGDKYKSHLPYLKILESPGMVLIQRTDSFRGKNILLWNAISGCWPIVVLTFLLSFVAGIGVWAMVSDSNC